MTENPQIDVDGTQDAQPSMPEFTWRTGLSIVIGLGLAAALIIFGLPFFAKTGWSEIGNRLSTVGWRKSLEFTGLMIVGLWIYTFTLTASWPGLSHSRAAIVNVTGSSVANTMPGGGATALAASWMILRSWGFKRRAISTGLIVSGIWNILARIALPLVGIAMVSQGAHALPPAVRTGALWGAVLGLLLLIGFILALTTPVRTRKLGSWLDRHVSPALGRLRRGDKHGVTPRFETLLADQQARMSALTRRGWFPMTLGVVGQLLVWFVLFWQVMRAVGVDLPVVDLFAAYAIGSLLRAVGITPGGLGVTEAGIVLVLVSWGADKPAAAAGALVFALFTHVAEIPLGALGWFAWWVGPKVPAEESA
ncbi:lysylphosphatidylglycerol synthase transmembrane domain-containing protein [Calidifontibacter terrae]